MALKIEKPQNLWGTLCLVKSLWFNEKNKQTKEHFLIPRKIFLPPKFTAQKSCRKKITSQPSTFLLLTFSYNSYKIFLDQVLLIQFFFSCVNWTAAYSHWAWPLAICKPCPRPLLKIRIVKISPTVHLFNLCQPSS